MTSGRPSLPNCDCRPTPAEPAAGRLHRLSCHGPRCPQVQLSTGPVVHRSSCPQPGLGRGSVGPRPPHSRSVTELHARPAVSRSRSRSSRPSPSLSRAARFQDWLGVAGDLLLGSRAAGRAEADDRSLSGAGAVVTGRNRRAGSAGAAAGRSTRSCDGHSYDPILKETIYRPTRQPAGRAAQWFSRRPAGQRRPAPARRARRRAGRRSGTGPAVGGARSGAVQVRGRAPRGRYVTPAIARHAAARLELDCAVSGCLRPVRRLADQSGLGALERQRNLAGALGARPRRAKALVSSGLSR